MKKKLTSIKEEPVTYTGEIWRPCLQFWEVSDYFTDKRKALAFVDKHRREATKVRLVEHKAKVYNYKYN